MAAILLIGGFALLQFSQSRYESAYSVRGLRYAMQGEDSPASDMSARLEASGSTQTIFGTSYLLLLTGAGAAITAVAVRRES